MDSLVQLIVLAPGILIALTFHEVAHGLVAYALGDPTAKEQGRLTLNPLKHLDLMGTIFFFLVKFGWAKPVPVVADNFENPRRGMALVSLAGPAANFVLAAGFGFLLKLNILGELATFLVWKAAQLNILLGVFNLLPIPPLDGSRLVAAVLPPSLLKQYEAVEGYGVALILVVIFFFPDRLWGLINPFFAFFDRLFLV